MTAWSFVRSLSGVPGMPCRRAGVMPGGRRLEGERIEHVLRGVPVLVEEIHPDADVHDQPRGLELVLHVDTPLVRVAVEHVHVIRPAAPRRGGEVFIVEIVGLDRKTRFEVVRLGDLVRVVALQLVRLRKAFRPGVVIGLERVPRDASRRRRAARASPGGGHPGPTCPSCP